MPCKYLGEYSLPQQNKVMHGKEKIKTNLLVMSDLQWQGILNPLATTLFSIQFLCHWWSRGGGSRRNANILVSIYCLGKKKTFMGKKRLRQTFW
jgi:hypothetical protein